ncbi:hypothetical protein IJ670_03595 [bacterium]|nr:hypothetical protein [bacterium]
MKTNAITTAQPNINKYSLPLTVGAGAVVGALSRYVLPTKSESGSLLNKQNFDTFVSSTAKRGADRSILKYGAAGAFVAATIYLISKAINYNKKNQEKFQSTMLGAAMDMPAYSVFWYADK